MSHWGVYMQVMKEDRPLWKFPWWGPEDNHALLVYYHRHGVPVQTEQGSPVSLGSGLARSLKHTYRLYIHTRVSPCMALCW